jgi:23S rRNA (cytosine1962-C5)-methyltransferase
LDQQVDYPKIILKPKEEGRLQAGHLWAFSNEIAEAPADLPAGVIADLYTADKGFLGRGFYNPHSLIAFRILSWQKDEDIDGKFFKKRLTESWQLREGFYPGAASYRWVFGESDRLPGLVIDRYNDYVAVQMISAGMNLLKEMIIGAIQEVIHPKGIICRSDAPLRELEGLTDAPPERIGEIPERISISLENGDFQVDLATGQKTGFYFDQRDNRQALAALCPGKSMLDAFCYSGGFGIAAARAGAKNVVFVDSSHPALELAQANIEQNRLEDRCRVVEGDVLQLMSHGTPEKFDVISMDPPAFARSKKHLPAALKAYERLNALAMSALPRGGILASSSCSHHVTREAFLDMLRRAAKKSHRNFRLIEFRAQAKDHPILLAMPETEYLKFVILQVI